MSASDSDEPSEPYDPGVEPAIRRLRRALLGEDDEVRAMMSLMRNARPIGLGFVSPEKGPFDAPPSVPIHLDPDDIPWELRDGEQSQ